MAVETDAIGVVTQYLDDHSPDLIAQQALMSDFGSGETITGPDAIGERLYQMYNVAFPGAEARVRNIAATDGSVTLEFDFVGTNTGPLAGLPATGRAVEVPFCAVYQVADGKIHSINLYWSPATMMGQLGR